MSTIAHVSRELVPDPECWAQPISFNHNGKSLQVDTVIFPFPNQGAGKPKLHTIFMTHSLLGDVDPQF